MNTITIDSNIYKGAEMYAKLHNISVGDAIEKGILLLTGNVRSQQEEQKENNFQDALAYVKTLKAKGGKPVPSDENDIKALVEKNIPYESIYRY